MSVHKSACFAKLRQYNRTASGSHCRLTTDCLIMFNLQSATRFLMLRSLIVCIALWVACMAQQPPVPDTESQRAAMKKLSFLVGKWSGEARILRGSGEPLELAQTEEAEYKLDGLVLMIEGIGRNKTDGKVALRALGLVSYDDVAGTYHMRAYND